MHDTSHAFVALGGEVRDEMRDEADTHAGDFGFGQRPAMAKLLVFVTVAVAAALAFSCVSFWTPGPLLGGHVPTHSTLHHPLPPNVASNKFLATQPGGPRIAATRQRPWAPEPRRGFLEDAQNWVKSLTASATASHILIKGGPEARAQLESIKAEIADDPDKFAQAAARYSACPSARDGGSLGSFGRGQMVPEFDKVVFSDEVGKVHGPVQTQFGYHLIYISKRD